MKFIFSILLFLTCRVCFGQVNDQNIRQQVLNIGIVDSLFIFGKWDTSGQTETRLKYLGQVTTENGLNFRIMTSSWFWGYSHHATSRILIFNDKNQYVGDYHLNMTYDLPDKLENGKLIFTNSKRDGCDRNILSEVNLKYGLPKSFFLECKEGYGDIYSFESN